MRRSSASYRSLGVREMRFAKIAFKNIRKKFGSYLIYFFSMTFSVMIFHLFCAIYFNPAFEEFRFGARKMGVLFRGSAVAVILFASVFVLYSNGYFIKAQKKEIAIYSLLGMRKDEIARMLFFETLFIGALALVAGTTLGTLTSGYFTTLLLRFMAKGTKVTLCVSPQAIAVTLAAFAVLFVASGVRAYATIYRYRLIELLSASQQRETMPRFSPLGAVVALLLTMIGYVISTVIKTDVSGMQLLLPAFIIILLMIAGTYLLFRNLVPMAVAKLKKNKAFYYSTTNFVSTSQVAFRLKANSKLLAIIALLTAITITMISASFSFYSVLAGDATKIYAPYSYLAKNITPEQHDRILQTVSEIGEVHVVSGNRITLVNVTIQNDRYAVKDQQTGEALRGQPAKAYLLSESAYQTIIAQTDTPTGTNSETKTSFKGGLDAQTCYFIDGNAVPDFCRDLEGQTMNVYSSDTATAFTVTGTALHKYIGALDLYKHPTVVVSDAVFEPFLARAASGDIDRFDAFQFDDNMLAERTVDAIDAQIAPRFHLGGLPENMSYIKMYQANFALFGSYAFIGFFLGTLFLLASGSVMYYKLIMEAQEEAPRYVILRKAGMQRREMLGSVAKQLGFVFGAPLAVGLMHTLFALLAYNRTLGAMGEQTPTLQNAALVVLVFIAVYGVFYGLSVAGYFKIVWNQTGEKRSATA